MALPKYFPFMHGDYDVKAGINALGKDFGNGEAGGWAVAFRRSPFPVALAAALDLGPLTFDQEMKRLNALYQEAASRLKGGAPSNDSEERTGFLTPDEAAELQRQNHAFMGELVEALEEIQVLRRALDSTAADAARHAEAAQALVDQRNLLYRDYAAQVRSRQLPL